MTALISTLFLVHTPLFILAGEVVDTSIERHEYVTDGMTCNQALLGLQSSLLQRVENRRKKFLKCGRIPVLCLNDLNKDLEARGVRRQLMAMGDIIYQSQQNRFAFAKGDGSGFMKSAGARHKTLSKREEMIFVKKFRIITKNFNNSWLKTNLNKDNQNCIYQREGKPLLKISSNKRGYTPKFIESGKEKRNYSNICRLFRIKWKANFIQVLKKHKTSASNNLARLNQLLGLKNPLFHLIPFSSAEMKTTRKKHRALSVAASRFDTITKAFQKIIASKFGEDLRDLAPYSAVLNESDKKRFNSACPNVEKSMFRQTWGQLFKSIGYDLSPTVVRASVEESQDAAALLLGAIPDMKYNEREQSRTSMVATEGVLGLVPFGVALGYFGKVASKIPVPKKDFFVSKIPVPKKDFFVARKKLGRLKKTAEPLKEAFLREKRKELLNFRSRMLAIRRSFGAKQLWLYKKLYGYEKAESAEHLENFSVEDALRKVGLNSRQKAEFYGRSPKMPDKSLVPGGPSNSYKLTPKEWNLFKSPPLKVKTLGGGRSDSYLVTLKNGYKGVFKPCRNNSNSKSVNGCLNEVLAAQIDRRLGLNLVPETIIKRVQINGKTVSGSFQKFIKKSELATKSSRTPRNKDIRKLKIFDAITQNFDRYGGHNSLVTKGRKLIAIDNGAAFKLEAIREAKLAKGEIEYLKTAAGQKIVNRMKVLTNKESLDWLSQYADERNASAIQDRIKSILKQLE